jgi:HEAT repeat protein
MDKVSKLINSFREENTNQLENVDSSLKTNIIAQLEDIEDERILPFFLDVLLDQQEYDLAKIEVLEVLKLKDCQNQAEYQKIGKIIRQVLTNDFDNNVRIYAAMAISNYIETEGVIDDLSNIILNENEDIDLRWNALTALEETPKKEIYVTILKKLVNIPEFRKFALRKLKEYEIFTNGSNY